MLQEKVNDRHGAIRLNDRTGTGGEVGRWGGGEEDIVRIQEVIDRGGE